MKTKAFKSIPFLILLIGAVLVSFSYDVSAQKKKGHAKGATKTHKKAHHKGKNPRSAHHKYAHLPKRGATIAKIGAGAVVITHKKGKYHYHNGIFYKPAGAASYVVVRPPRGARIKVLPYGYKRMVLAKTTYIYYYGTYYKRVPATEEYEVVAAPIGAQVDALPKGYETTVVDGVEYYTLDDAKYVAKGEGDATVYEVVSTK